MVAKQLAEHLLALINQGKLNEHAPVRVYDPVAECHLPIYIAEQTFDHIDLDWEE